MIAALHFNENSARPSARTKEGDVQYKISFPKFKQGEYTVRKKSVEATYGKPLYSFYPFIDEQNIDNVQSLIGKMVKYKFEKT